MREAHWQAVEEAERVCSWLSKKEERHLLQAGSLRLLWALRQRGSNHEDENNYGVGDTRINSATATVGLIKMDPDFLFLLKNLPLSSQKVHSYTLLLEKFRCSLDFF
jgi:hypothetical protein